MFPNHALRAVAVILVRLPCPDAALMAQQQSPAGAASEQDTVVWTYTANDKISFQLVTSLGSLAIATKRASGAAARHRLDHDPVHQQRRANPDPRSDG